MDKKELFKKYWFVGLVGIVLIAFIGLYSYDAYKNRDIVVRNKQIDGKYVAYTIDGEPVYADDLYESLYNSDGISQTLWAFEKAIFAEAYETTDEMKEKASTSAANILSYYSKDYLDGVFKGMGYVNGVDDIVDYYIDSQKQEMLLKEYVLAHKDEYLDPTMGTNGKLIYHILIKCDTTPIYDEEDDELIIGYEANPTDEQKEKLQTVLDELAKEDASFEYIAYQYSEDSGSANKGGYIGIVNEENAGNYVPQFSEAALALEEGGITDPVVTSYGYHIIKCLGSDTEVLLNDYNVIDDIDEAYPTMSIKAILDKAEKLGFEIKDADLMARINEQLESEGE
ncbi:MAG: peptidyl-prolyl cis-trans isomerase [Erysipelotrichaceae bacterium]|nr:peptidyl-prolyl cis-trans isomerase [Erysipelotrichaceae bacterium]